MDWVEFKGDDQAWDTALMGFLDPTMHHLSSWKRVRESLGENTVRLVVYDDQGQMKSMAQLRLKTWPLGGVYAMVWGGILGQPLYRELYQFMTQNDRVKYAYIKLQSFKARNVLDVINMKAAGFTPVLTPIHSGLSVMLTIDPTKPREPLHSNWQRNLKKALAKNLVYRVWEEPKLEEILRVFASMEDSKGLEALWSESELKALVHEAKHSILWVYATDESEEVLSLIACVKARDLGYHLLAASSARGRQIYASFGVMDFLIKTMQDQGLLRYDYGGIDPLDGPGVFQFKRGSGALPFEYLGEWERSSHLSIIWIFNALLKLKLNGFKWPKFIPRQREQKGLRPALVAQSQS